MDEIDSNLMRHILVDEMFGTRLYTPALNSNDRFIRYFSRQKRVCSCSAYATELESRQFSFFPRPTNGRKGL